MIVKLSFTLLAGDDRLQIITSYNAGARLLCQHRELVSSRRAAHTWNHTQPLSLICDPSTTLDAQIGQPGLQIASLSCSDSSVRTLLS